MTDIALAVGVIMIVGAAACVSVPLGVGVGGVFVVVGTILHEVGKRAKQ